MSIKRKIATAVAVTATAASTLVATTGTADAAVWNCGSFTYCTSVVYSTGVYSSALGTGYLYQLPQGVEFTLNCWVGGLNGTVWYLGHRDGWASGLVLGDALATGFDPNPLIAHCG